MIGTIYSFTQWPTPEEAGITDTDLCDAWHERVAIATVDSGLDEQAARAVAWREIGGPGLRRRIEGRRAPQAESMTRF